MARRADLFHLNEQRVAIAVKSNVFDLLHMTAGFALHPEFLARAAPEMRFACGDGLFQRGAVHPRHHQDATGALLLDDGGNQAVRIKFQFIVKAHATFISPQRYKGTKLKFLQESRPAGL